MFGDVSGPLSAPGARRTLLISLVMSALGLTGVMTSLAFVRSEPQTMPPADAPPGTEAAAELVHLLSQSPVLQGSAVANLLASALLVFASLQLTARRPSAPWWARQAIVANVFYTLGHAAAMSWFVLHNEARFLEVMTAIAQAQAEAGGQPAAAVDSSTTAVLLVMVSCVGALTLLIYGALALGLRSADVREFLQKGAASG